MRDAIPERVVIISLDAVGSEDFKVLKKMPAVSSCMKEASFCEHVKSVYPSLTYPAHTSIVTGRMPIHHGIINNTRYQPRRNSPDWFWQRQYISGTTLYDEAIRKGMTVASLLWPVTAKSKIQYCLPEVLANRPWQNQLMVSAWNSSFLYALTLQKKFGHIRKGIRQPELDDFVEQSALFTIRKYRPQLMLVHFTDVDSNRHLYGRNHPAAAAALQRHDVRIAHLMEALRETGSMEKTTVVILGDHCQFDTNQVMYPNGYLQKEGLLNAKGDKLISYDFIAKNCDGACYVYANPKRKADEAKMKKVTELFKRLSEKENSGIEQIFTGKEAGKMGADDTCVLMLEAAKGWYFLDDFNKMTDAVKNEKKHPMYATHGYLPDKSDYDTFFLATGCGIKKEIQVAAMHLWDEGTTLAKLMNLNLGETDGRIVREILESEA